MLVCSCVFVLGFAEHMSTAIPEVEAQPHWWQTACSLAEHAASMVSSWVTALCTCVTKKASCLLASHQR